MLALASVRISSAGAARTAVRSEAVQAVAEIGIDAPEQQAKAIASLVDADTVGTLITLCAGEVRQVVLSRVLQVHWPLPNPVTVSGKKERLAAFRAVRDALCVRLEALFKDWPEAP